METMGIMYHATDATDVRLLNKIFYITNTTSDSWVVLITLYNIMYKVIFV